jgi:WD40 repeat protein
MSEPRIEPLTDDEEMGEELDTEFEALGRRAGAARRRPPPPGAMRAVEHSARRRRTASGVAIAGAVVVVVAAAAALVLGVGDAEEPLPVTVPPTVVDPAPVAPQALDLVHDGLLDGVVVTPDGSVAITLAASGVVSPYVVTGWDLRTGEQLFEVAQFDNDGPWLGMSSNGLVFAIRTNPDVVRFLSAADGAPVDPVDVIWTQFGSPVVSPDGALRVEWDGRDPVRLVGSSMSTVLVEQPVEQPVERETVAAFSGDGSHVAVAAGDELVVWRTFDAAPVASFRLPAGIGPADRVALDHTGSVVVASVGDRLVVRPVPTAPAPDTPDTVEDSTGGGGPIDHVLAHDAIVMDLVFSPDGRWIATSTGSRLADPGCVGATCAVVFELRLWDVWSGVEVVSADIDQPEVGANMAFTVDSAAICVGAGSSERCLDRGGRPATRSVGLEPGPTRTSGRDSRVTSPDGRWVAETRRLRTSRVGRTDGSIDHDLLEVVSFQAAAGSGVAFSADSSMVAEKNGAEAAAWTLEPFRELRRFELPPWSGTADVVAFSPDGRRFAFTLEDDVYVLHLGGAS